MRVDIYTDGSIVGGNPGGAIAWCAILVMGNRRRIITDHEKVAAHNSNNRAELLAVIEGLSALRTRTQVRLVSDSEYVVKAFAHTQHGRRIDKWAASNFTRKRNRSNGTVAAKAHAEYERVPNADLWERLNELDLRHDVEWVHIKGHAGATERGENRDARFNHICHEWALSEARIVFEAHSKGITPPGIPNSLEGRATLYHQIKELKVLPPPPVSEKREVWYVYERLSVSTKAALKGPIWRPMEPGGDKGKAQAELAGKTMSRTDDTKIGSKFRQRYVDRFVALCGEDHANREEENGAA